ncbi:hypothetical protein D3C76_1471430 [compost metagenome]
MLALEGGKQVRYEILGAGFHRQFQLALQRALHVRQLHVEVFQATEDVPARTLQGFRRFGHVEFFADIIEQRLAHQLFKLTNLQADGRLCE